MRQLRDAGIACVSLGVQSFQAEKLALIGRRYDPGTAESALELLVHSGFASVNADIMFALPGQTAQDVISDLTRAMQLGANQITTYPLFTFPYTTVGEYLRLKAVRMPNLRTRRSQYRAISAWCVEHGFERVSVWGFKHGDVPRYSSVTRDSYIGIGPGAGSHLPDGFVLNTFDLNTWTREALAGQKTVALRMPFAGEMAGWWWLYWRLYDTHIPLKDLDVMLGKDAVQSPPLVKGSRTGWIGSSAWRDPRTDRARCFLATSGTELLRIELCQHAMDSITSHTVATCRGNLRTFLPYFTPLLFIAPTPAVILFVHRGLKNLIYNGIKIR